jgi:hypothetical protein
MAEHQIKYKSGYKYQLQADYRHPQQLSITASDDDIDIGYIVLSSDGYLLIRAGYAWDGPSGPTFDTRNFMRGSLVHDALYQLMRNGLIDKDTHRDAADRELARICREDGMSRMRACWVYWGVRLGGDLAADEKFKKKIHTAP